LIVIVGPSSSGKTTTTAKLAQKLKAQGIDLVALNIDNYFFNLELHPKDEFEDYDFETPEALDLNLINKHLTLLLEGKSVEIPRYDFGTGKRLKETDTIKLKPGQVLLIDTLHGLYEPMTEAVPHDVKFKLYIETLSQLRDKNNRFVRWYDIRMLRRMVRDVRARGYNPLRTVGHWHYVRRAELKHIVPFISQANYIVNGALAYDLPLLKHYLFSYFPDILKTFKGDEKRQDAYIRANRVYKLLSSIEEADDTHIAKDSLVREFIGGSIYNHCT
jgi:uridine kinase